MNQDEHASLPAFIVLSPNDIAARAHEKYVNRGRTDGFDLEDWLCAEHELRIQGQDAYYRELQASEFAQ